MYRIELVALGLIAVASASAQPSVQGKWSGQAALPDGAQVRLYLDVSQDDGGLKMSADVVAPDLSFAMADFDETEPSFDGRVWSWKLEDPAGNPVLCRVELQEDGSAQGACQAGEVSVQLTLRRDDSNPWVANDFAVADAPEEGVRYVDALAAAVQAFGRKDFEAFDELFTPNTVGMQPNELYRAAFQVVTQFGAIRKLEFVGLEEGSARLRLHLGETARDFIVQLEDGKIRELTYVPPAQRHQDDRP